MQHSDASVKAAAAAAAAAAALPRPTVRDSATAPAVPGASLGSIVELNVYDLQPPDSPDTVSHINWYLYPVGFGIYHSGVSVYGREYCYGGHPEANSGIFAVSPKKAPDARFRQTLFIGRTHLSPTQVLELIDDMAQVWAGNSYNLLNRNCNHFASDLCERLTGIPAPEWVNRLAWLAEKAKFLLPTGMDMISESPVSAPAADSDEALSPSRRRNNSDPDHHH